MIKAVAWDIIVPSRRIVLTIMEAIVIVRSVQQGEDMWVNVKKFAWESSGLFHVTHSLIQNCKHMKDRRLVARFGMRSPV